MFGLCFVMHYLVPFLVCNHVEKRAVCFTLVFLLMSCDCNCSAALPHGAMCWSAVCVIVVFPDHTHLPAES